MPVDLNYTYRLYTTATTNTNINGYKLTWPNLSNTDKPNGDKEVEKLQPTTKEIEDCRKALKEQNQRFNDENFNREISISLAQVLIGLPIWLFHWSVIQKENRKKRDE